MTELGRNDLSSEDKEQLIRLRWLWEKSYGIDCAGGTWTARRLDDPEKVLTEPSSQKLWLAIKDDNARRRSQTSRDGYWIETCSGPPYFVATPPAERFRNPG